MKHETWRHDPSAYGSTQPVAARFADIDTRRHVNNIAVYGLHHEARQRWLMAAGGGLPKAARIDLHFVHHWAPPAQGRWPRPSPTPGAARWCCGWRCSTARPCKPRPTA